MANEPPRKHVEPQSLAESVASAGSTCPIPFTHDRLFETHHWWHEIARNYHEPDPFRYALGAFIQASRNVTFMLQKEEAAFTDFSWYRVWAEQAKGDTILSWLAETRTGIVHQHALEPHSWLEMRCLDDPNLPHGTDKDPMRISYSPFNCTHEYMNMGPSTDHAHEYTRYWGIDGLPNQELLSACAYVYDQLDGLVADAHNRLDANMTSYRTEGSTRALPCMEDVVRHRVARSTIRNGREVWENEPDGLHRHG